MRKGKNFVATFFLVRIRMLDIGIRKDLGLQLPLMRILVARHAKNHHVHRQLVPYPIIGEVVDLHYTALLPAPLASPTTLFDYGRAELQPCCRFQVVTV